MPNWHNPVGTEEQDKFGYFDYVEPLATQLFNSSNGFTLGIFGGWGQGKTSLMDMLLRRVKQRRKTVLTVWFDAWKFDRSDVVWRALLAQTLNDLEARTTTTLEGLKPRQDDNGQPDAKLEKKKDELNAWIKDELEPLKEQLYRSFTRTEKATIKLIWRALQNY